MTKLSYIIHVKIVLLKMLTYCNKFKIYYLFNNILISFYYTFIFYISSFHILYFNEHSSFHILYFNEHFGLRHLLHCI